MPAVLAAAAPLPASPLPASPLPFPTAATRAASSPVPVLFVPLMAVKTVTLLVFSQLSLKLVKIRHFEPVVDEWTRASELNPPTAQIALR